MPAKSKAQFRAMAAAAHGKSRLGIPKSVAREFVRETRSVRNLPEHVKKHRSPDSYDDTALGETPPRREYHAEQEGLHARMSKKAGGIPAAVQQASGTEALREGPQTKMAGRSGPSGGRTRWPAGVQHFNDREV